MLGPLPLAAGRFPARTSGTRHHGPTDLLRDADGTGELESRRNPYGELRLTTRKDTIRGARLHQESESANKMAGSWAWDPRTPAASCRSCAPRGDSREMGGDHPSIASTIASGLWPCTNLTSRTPKTERKRSAGTVIGPGDAPAPGAGCGQAVDAAV
jgi:hypothetical protein